MAVPTLASVAPVSGAPTGGQAIELVGTDFRLPTAPGPGIPVPPSPPSVRVLIGGVEARVDVISDTRLFAYTPKRSMPISGAVTLGTEVVDVEVVNIDDDGVPIPGESDAIVGAYTYQRPGISHQESGDFLRVTMHLVDLLRSEVLANTVISTDTDFDPDTGTPVIEVGTTPQLILTGPSIRSNSFFTFRGSYSTPMAAPGEYAKRRRHRVVDLSFLVLAVTNSDVELINLQELFETVIDRNPSLFLQVDVNDSSAGTIELELHLTEDPLYERVEQHARSNLHVFRASLLVKGFPMGVLPGVVSDAVLSVTHEVTEEPTLEAPLQIGENLPAVQGSPTRSPPEQAVPSFPRWPAHGAPTRSPPDAEKQT